MDIDNMSAEQLKHYIYEKKEKLRLSQQKYVKRQKAEGHYRINAFITSEAAVELKRLKHGTKKTVGDIISELLCNSSMYHLKKSIESLETSASKKRIIRPDISGDIELKSVAEKRIGELSAQGLGPAAIARQMEAEGIKSPGGLKKWQRGTVHRILKRLAQE